MEQYAKYASSESSEKLTTSENVRYLLWRQPVARERWEATTANWAGCGMERARALLRGTMPNPEELANLAAAASVSEPDIAYGRLADARDILLENLRFLFEGFEKGAKKELAMQVGVHPGTISEWLSGRQRPTGKKLDRLARAFGLRDGAQLSTEPVFLSLDPVALQQRRAWVKERIDKLDDRTLTDLFPALKRLLEDR